MEWCSHSRFAFAVNAAALPAIRNLVTGIGKPPGENGRREASLLYRFILGFLVRGRLLAGMPTCLSQVPFASAG